MTKWKKLDHSSFKSQLGVVSAFLWVNPDYESKEERKEPISSVIEPGYIYCPEFKTIMEMPEYEPETSKPAGSDSQ